MWDDFWDTVQIGFLVGGAVSIILGVSYFIYDSSSRSLSCEPDVQFEARFTNDDHEVRTCFSIETLPERERATLGG